MGPELLVLSVFAVPPPLPGEWDTGAVLRSSCYLNPYANDVFGKTDKLISHSISIGCGGRFGTEAAQEGYDTQRPSPSPPMNSTTYASQLHWRLFTPIVKTKHNSRELKTPVGSYADWMEWQTTAAKAWPSAGFYAQGSLSIHHIGPKGGGDLQNDAHQWAGLATRYDWSTQRRIFALGGSGETGHTSTVGPLARDGLRVGLGWAHSPLVNEPYASVRLNGKLPLNLQWSSNLLVAWPQSSPNDLVPIDNTRPRLSTGATIGFLDYLYTSAALSTPYVTGDNFRQIVITPLGVLAALP